MAAGSIRYFEDVTGNLTATVFRDALDHASPANIRVSPLVPGLPENRSVLEIRRASSTLVVLDFSASLNSLGTISLTSISGDTPRRLEQFLWPQKNKRGRIKRFLSHRTALSPRSFIACDGKEYTWTLRADSTPGTDQQPQTFVCTSAASTTLVAHYHQLPTAPPGVDSDAPSAVLEIAVESTPLLPELIATLTIMRYIEKYPEAQSGVRL